MPHGDATPYSKARQLERGERRKSRKVASRREWTALRAAKDGPCRVCTEPAPNELHHLISRARGGNDEAANLVPLCVVCHDAVTCFKPDALRLLLDSLTEDEYATVCAFGIERIFAAALT